MPPEDRHDHQPGRQLLAGHDVLEGPEDSAEVAADLAGALDTRLARLGVQVEIGSSPTTKGQVVLQP